MNTLQNTRVNYSEVSVANLISTSTGVTISFEIILNSAASSSFEDLDLLQSGLGPYRLDPNAPYRIIGVSPSGESYRVTAIVIMYPPYMHWQALFILYAFNIVFPHIETCQCGLLDDPLDISSGYLGDFLKLCFRLSLSPCNCSITCLVRIIMTLFHHHWMHINSIYLWFQPGQFLRFVIKLIIIYVETVVHV